MNFTPLPLYACRKSQFFDWMCSRMSPRIKQDVNQIHMKTKEHEMWEHTKPSSCNKSVRNMWQCDSLLIPNFELVQCWRWGVFCLHHHDSATQYNLLEAPNPPKITSNITLSRIISIGTRDFRFSYICIEVLLILWCWVPNFISIKNYTQNYIRPQGALPLSLWISMYNAAVMCCSQFDRFFILTLYCWMSLVDNECMLSRIQIFRITRFIIFTYFSRRVLFLSVIFPFFSHSGETI